MNLYEITTGWTGESYERCYVWAPDEHIACELFHEKYGDTRDSVRTSVKFLFSADAEPFVTELSTEGWES